MSASKVNLITYAWPQRLQLSALLGTSLLSAGLAALAPWPLKLIIDNVLKGVDLPANLTWLTALPGATTATGLLAWLAIGTLLVFCATRLVQWVQAALNADTRIRLKQALGADLFDHMQRLPLAFHTKSMVGDLVRRIDRDCECISIFWMHVVLPIFGSLTTLLFIGVIMWQLDPILTLVAMGVALPLGFVCQLLTPWITARSYHQSELEGKVLAVAEQTLSAMPAVQAFDAADRETDRFRAVTDSTIGAYLKLLLSQVWFKLSVESITAIGLAIVLVVGGLNVLQGELTVGGLVVALSYVSAMYAPVESLAHLTGAYADAKARFRRVNEVMMLENDLGDPADPATLSPVGPGRGRALTFRHVDFSYDGRGPALQDVDLKIDPGKVVALVGETGAGKSTLTSLALRLYDPDSGAVTIDGVDLRDLTLDTLRAQIAIVQQNSYLLPLTIAENIAYGRPTARRDEIEAAAESAGADDFVRALPQGFDTLVGEKGASLSGGERQRLAIARAFLKDAPIMILDEPTAALDAKMEATLVTSLEKLMRGRTTLIIAHRLSTIRTADQIAVMRDGRIVECGKHSELLARDSYFKRLYDLQSGAKEPGDSTETERAP